MSRTILALVDELTLHRIQRGGRYTIEHLADAPSPLAATTTDSVLLVDYERLHELGSEGVKAHSGPRLLVVVDDDEDRAIALIEAGFDEYLLRSQLDGERVERALRRAQARWEYRERVDREAALARLRHTVGDIVEQEHDLARLGERLCHTLVDGYFRAAWLAINVPLASRRTFSRGWERVPELRLGQPPGEPPSCIMRVTDPFFAQEESNAQGCCQPCNLRRLLDEQQLVSVPLQWGKQRFGLLCCAMPAGVAARELERTAIETLANEISRALAALLTSADLERLTEQLRALERRFRSAFDSTEVGMALLALDGRLTEVNNALCSYFGRERDELLGLTFADVTHPLDLRAASQGYEDLRTGRRDAFSLEKRYLHGKTGATIWGIASVAVVRDGEGRASYFVAHVQDIDRRKRMEEALAHSEARYRSYISTSPDGFAVLDHDGVIVEANEALERMSGASRAALLGRRLIDLRDEQAASAAGAERFARLTALAFDAPLSVDLPVQTLHGERRVWSLHAARVEEGALVFCRDITTERQLQSRLAQADRMASVGVLASGVAHEINNPLAFVLLNLEGLDADLSQLLAPVPGLDAELRDDVLERIGDAIVGARRVRSIVRDLKTFARVDEGRRVPTALDQVLDGAVAMAHNELKYRAVLERSYAQGVPEVVVNDGKLAQVALNLLVNAAHAIDEGERQNNRVELKTFCDDEFVGFSITDTGKGIDRDRLELIFEPFVSTKEVGVGSGLGLSICRSIVEGLGGRITVESRLGEGSCFSVFLPLSLAHVRPSPRQTTGELPAMRPLRVMVIDDEISLGQAMERMLRRLDHEVVVAASAREALALLAADDRFDAVLCDMMMPELSGVDLHRQLQAHHPQLAERTIFVTGGAFTPQTAEYLNRVDHLKLEKPFAANDLEQVLQRLMARMKRVQVA